MASSYSSVSAVLSIREFIVCGYHRPVDLTYDLSFYAATDFGLGSAFANVTGELVAGGLVAAHPEDADDVQCVVGVAVSAADEPVPHGFTAGCFDGRDTAEFSERGVRPDAFGVAAEADTQQGGRLRSVAR
jgi:hypothetical protein